MKITVQNLGILKEAMFELGDLTVICGLNNTGKTYATYALYGFLENWRGFLKADVSGKEIDQIIDNGVGRIDLARHAIKTKNILAKGCMRYTKELPRIFASDSKYFSEAKFLLDLDQKLASILHQPFERKLQSTKSELVSFSKPKGIGTLDISLSADHGNIDLPRRMIKDAIIDVFNEILFKQYFPTPFIASTERTGVAIFSKELDYTGNRLLEEMDRSSKGIDPLELLFKYLISISIS
ncbi:MAG: AAA family ATPase [Bacteroidetes bacterium]|nr:AAA family ATPase [Bacteroidota bacterium]